MNRLVVVSNRVPAPSAAGAQAGGLAVALEALMERRGGVWFGWSGSTSDAPSAEPESTEKEGIRYVTIDLPRREFELYYDGFCNSTLWPLHHYFPGAFRYDAGEFEAYLAINRMFAAALTRFIEPGDTIWIHDYQLMPLAAMLRAQGVQARLVGLTGTTPTEDLEACRAAGMELVMTKPLRPEDLLSALA